MFNLMSAASAFTFGVPGFFTPRVPPPFMVLEGSPRALSFYDTQPLKATLEELVDFDLINRQGVRLSLGAVNVRWGQSMYVDNKKMWLGPEHVMASGALHRVLDNPPPELQADPDVKRLAGISTRRAVTLVHFINLHDTKSSDYKDYEFPRARVTKLWDFGYVDACKSLASDEWQSATNLGNGVRVYDLTASDVTLYRTGIHEQRI